jgi:uncharacterized protein YndB with AHSA1/START domain
VTSTGHGSAVIELPNDRDVVITRAFDAPIAIVFDVLTKPEHVRKWFAGPGEEMTECSIDLRVGGSYHYVFVTVDGTEMSFRSRSATRPADRRDSGACKRASTESTAS